MHAASLSHQAGAFHREPAPHRPDLYPSRTGGPERLLPRRDPVVWGRPGGPLTPEQVDRFERQGFLLLPDILHPHDLAACLEARDHLFADPAHLPPDEVVREPESERAVRSIFRVHRRHPFFRWLSKYDPIAGAAAQLLASPVYVHQSRINDKPGVHGKPFPWHADFETWHVEDGMSRPRAISASLALTDNTSFNGPLLVMPGSHRVYVSCGGTTPEANHRTSLRRQIAGSPSPAMMARLYERFGVEEITGSRGSLLLFDSNLMHGSNSNISPLPRSNVFFVYNSVANRCEAPFGARRPRPAFLAERPQPVVQAEATSRPSPRVPPAG